MFEGSEETFIILQNTLLASVTKVSFDYQVNEQATLLLSNRGINRKINKPQTARCSISKIYTNRDFLQELTGVTDLSGKFIYGDKGLQFNNAAIKNYAVSVGAQKVPKISVDLEIYGDLKPITGFDISQTSGDYKIKDLDFDSIALNMDDTNSAVTDFDYNVEFDVQPTYEIESVKSSAVKIITPVKYGCTAKVEMIEQEFENITGLINSETFNRNISFSFFDADLQTLNSYSVPNASLSSQSVSITPRDTIQLDLKYNGYSLSANRLSTPAANSPLINDDIPAKVQLQDFNSFVTGEFDSGYMQFLPGVYDEVDFSSEFSNASNAIDFEYLDEMHGWTHIDHTYELFMDGIQTRMRIDGVTQPVISSVSTGELIYSRVSEMHFRLGLYYRRIEPNCDLEIRGFVQDLQSGADGVVFTDESGFKQLRGHEGDSLFSRHTGTSDLSHGVGEDQSAFVIGHQTLSLQSTQSDPTIPIRRTISNGNSNNFKFIVSTGGAGQYIADHSQLPHKLVYRGELDSLTDDSDRAKVINFGIVTGTHYISNPFGSNESDVAPVIPSGMPCTIPLPARADNSPAKTHFITKFD